ncbi:peptidase M76 family-domain-containing protein [Mycena floridula]|nr:peptidase M76 family-domain-containing protein [Mycena floridula]
MSAPAADVPPAQPEAGSSSPPGGSTAFEKWRKRASYMTGLGSLSPEDTHYFRKQECEAGVKDLKESSPIVIFLLKHLALSGCTVPPQNIQCMPCDLTHAGGFIPEPGAVQMCAGNFLSRSHMESSLAHELIHMYDHCKFKVDWGNLRHHACSEIRANSLSGDCRFTSELRRGSVGFSKNHQACIRRRAVVSVAANPNCPDQAAAEKAVNEVFDSCFKDTRPFDEVPTV